MTGDFTVTDIFTVEETLNDVMIYSKAIIEDINSDAGTKAVHLLSTLVASRHPNVIADVLLILAGEVWGFELMKKAGTDVVE